jgi:hypothetical protein
MDRFESAARSRFWIYEEEQNFDWGEALLRLIRNQCNYRGFFYNPKLNAYLQPLSNPDQILIFGQSLILVEMKKSFHVNLLRSRQLGNIPHNVAVFWNELKSNEFLQQKLGLTNPENIMDVNYNPADPFSNWLAIGENRSKSQRIIDGLGLESAISIHHHANASSPFVAFDGPSPYTIVSMEYGRIAHAPHFHIEEYETSYLYPETIEC